MRKNYLNNSSIAITILTTIFAFIFIHRSINENIDSGPYIALPLQIVIIPTFFIFNLIFIFIYLIFQKSNDNHKTKTLFLQLLSLLSLTLLLAVTFFYTISYKNIWTYTPNYAIPTILCILILVNTTIFSFLYRLKIKKVH